MAEKKVSVLVVDERSEVRDSLADLLRSSGVRVSVAEGQQEGMEYFPESNPKSWPDVMILGQGDSQRGAEQVTSLLQTERKDILGKVSVIVVPLFRVALPSRGPNGENTRQVCRLSTMSNLLTLVRGIAKKKALTPEAC